VARLLGPVKPNLMVTDPPYGVEYDADWRNRADRANGKPYGASAAIGLVTNDERLDWREAYALFPGQIAYVWHAGRHASEVQRSLEAATFAIRCQIVWAKTRFVISRGDYHWQHEPCWYAVRQKGHWTGDRSQSTLWEIDHQKSETGHSTQKPVECMRRPIVNNSSVGQAVYDPFVGSGTTMIAAEMEGRAAFCMEISEAYVDVAVNRWESFTGEKAERAA
jgi:DNA modification methylase